MTCYLSWKCIWADVFPTWLDSVAGWCISNLTGFCGCRSSTKIFIGNIKVGTSSDQLRTTFEEYGKVTEADVIGGYGFVVSIYVCHCGKLYCFFCFTIYWSTFCSKTRKFITLWTYICHTLFIYLLWSIASGCGGFSVIFTTDDCGW